MPFAFGRWTRGEHHIIHVVFTVADFFHFFGVPVRTDGRAGKGDILRISGLGLGVIVQFTSHANDAYARAFILFVGI